MDGLKDMIRVSILGSSNASSRKDTPAFDPKRDIPSLAGKIILITGAAGDLGRQTAIELARYGRPARIYIADLPCDGDVKKTLLERVSREAYEDNEKSDTAEPESEIRYLELDLTSFDSVRRCAAHFVAQEQRLDVLFLNAGVIRAIAGKTPEGYELHFGLNYLGHALLAKLLVPTLLRTANHQPDADVRIVITSSEGHVSSPKGGVDYDLIKTDCANIHFSKRYGQSKVALIGLMKELAVRHPQIRAVAIHPGRILTGMASNLAKESALVRWTTPIGAYFCVPVTVGIRNHLWASTSLDAISGTYYEPVGVPGTLSAAAKEEGFSKKLWDWTEDALNAVKQLD